MTKENGIIETEIIKNFIKDIKSRYIIYYIKCIEKG